MDQGLEALGGLPFVIQASRRRPGEVRLGGPGGFFRSLDGGWSFQRSNDGLAENATVIAMAINPNDENHLVAKTGGSAYVSFDGGAIWVESISGAYFSGYDIVADTGIPGRFYATSNVHHLWISHDGGLSFVPHDLGTSYFFHLEPHPTQANVVFGAGAGVQKSMDGGQTFTSLGFPSGWVWDVAVCETDPNVIYGNSSRNVYVSRDGGGTWMASESPPPVIVRDLEVDPLNPDRCYAAAPHAMGGHAIYRTDDGGVTWHAIPDSTRAPWVVHCPSAAPGLVLTSDMQYGSAIAYPHSGDPSFELAHGLRSPARDYESTGRSIYSASAGHGVWVLR